MKPLPDNTDKTAARLLETTVRETTGRWYGSAFHSTIADMAALGVAREEQHDEGGCDMHQAGKIARRGIADLPRSKGKVVQDPFPEAQALMKKTHRAATWVSASGAKQKELVALVDTRSMDAPKIRIKVDLNTTRVSARLNLIFTTLRMHKVIKMYSALYPGSRPARLTDADFQTLAEIEAIMHASADVAVLVQTERFYVKAIGWPLQMRMFERLRASTLEVIRLSAITASPRLDRRSRSVSLLNEISKEVLRRSTLEAERRLASNLAESLTGDDPVLGRSTITMLATMPPDPRTATCMHLPEYGRTELIKHMCGLLKNE